jgi:hypothetical protein
VRAERRVAFIDPIELRRPEDLAADQVPLAPAEVAEAFGAGQPLGRRDRLGRVAGPAEHQTLAEAVGAHRPGRVAVAERLDLGRAAGVEDGLIGRPPFAADQVGERADPGADQPASAHAVGGDRLGADRGPDQVGQGAVVVALGHEVGRHAGHHVEDPLDHRQPRLEAPDRGGRRAAVERGGDEPGQRLGQPDRLGAVEQPQHRRGDLGHLLPPLGGRAQQVPVCLRDAATGPAGEQADRPVDRAALGLAGGRAQMADRFRIDAVQPFPPQVGSGSCIRRVRPASHQPIIRAGPGPAVSCGTGHPAGRQPMECVEGLRRSRDGNPAGFRSRRGRAWPG